LKVVTSLLLRLLPRLVFHPQRNWKLHHRSVCVVHLPHRFILKGIESSCRSPLWPAVSSSRFILKGIERSQFRLHHVVPFLFPFHPQRNWKSFSSWGITCSGVCFILKGIESYNRWLSCIYFFSFILKGIERLKTKT